MNKKKLIGSLVAIAILLAASFLGLTEDTSSPQATFPTESIQLETAAALPVSQTTPSGQQTEASTEPQISTTTTEPQISEQSQTQTQPPATQPPATQSPATQPPQQTEPAAPAGSAAIVDAAYQLSEGQALDDSCTLTGYITSIKTAYSEKYENITVIIVVPGSEDQPIQCFRLKGSGAESLAVGDTITVTGTLMNYKGTIEFDAGCVLSAVVKGETSGSAETQPPAAATNDDSKDYVAWYIHTYGCLPSYYVTKNQAEQLYGWSGGALDQRAPGMCIGGDRFGNYEGLLPDAPGRYWTECDIDTIGRSSRGSKRIVFSNDGLVYYTDDHYESFELLYGEP